MAERWETKARIAAARERMEAALPGWERPAAHALGIHRQGRTRFDRVNVGGNFLPAVVLAAVCGHGSGTRTYPVSAQQVDQAIAALAPAEACTELAHPNLVHWRRLREELASGGGQAVAVFAADLADPPVDAHDAAFRAAVAADSSGS